MHFSVFFCVGLLLASESFVTAMPLTSFRNVLEPQQIMDKNSDDLHAIPRIIPLEGKIQDRFQSERDYDSYKSLKIINNAGNSPTSENHVSPKKAVRDNRDYFPNLYLESPKPKLDSLVKRTGELNVGKKEDYSSDYRYINGFMQDKSANELIAPVNTLREPDATMESSSAIISLSEIGLKDVRRTSNLKNIPPIVPSEMVELVENKLKPYEEGRISTKEKKLEGRQEHKPVDEVVSGFTPQRTSQRNYQKKVEHHLEEGEQERTPLRRKQRNTGVFWRKRDMHLPGYGTSAMLEDPEDESLLQNDLSYGLESSTQYSFVPNPRDISYGTGSDTYIDLGSINSPEVNEDDTYMPEQPLNSIQGNVLEQNYQQNDQPFQLSRLYDHNFQPLPSLTNTANDMPSNTYLTANSYQSGIVPGLPAEPSDYVASASPDENTISFNKDLIENDNIGIKSQEMLPPVGGIKHLPDNQDKDYEQKYDGMFNVRDQNDKVFYPGLLRHNSYVGDNVIAPGLSDSLPSEHMQTDKDITFNNYKKTNNFLNNESHEDYSNNREFQERYIEGDNHIANDRHYYSDTEIPSYVQQRYSYYYPEMDMRVSPQLHYNPDTNKIEMRDSDAFPPMNSMSYRTAIVNSEMPRKSQYEFHKNTRKNLFKRYKKPRKYVSARRNSQMSPYSQDNEFTEFHPRQYETQDSMANYEYSNFDSDNRNQLNTNNRWKLQYDLQMLHSNVSDNQKEVNMNCTEDTTVSNNGPQPQKEEDTSDFPNDMDEVCNEEESTEMGSTETTTVCPNTESSTAEDVKQKDKLHTKKNLTPDSTCKTDFPCNVNGAWYSHIGGALLCLQMNKNGKLNVKILTTPSYYTGHGKLSKSWKITGELPFNPKMKSFISLKAIESAEHKFATFIGECFTCGSEDVIYGSWLFGRPAHSCKDQHISTAEYKDIFKKSHLHNLKKKSEKVNHKSGV